MTVPANFYADFKGLAELKNSAAQHDPKALREVARQFESIFTQMMLKSMRDASMGESLMDNDQSKFYMEMFDNQLASQLSKGRGLGLADMLVRQLTQAGMAGEAAVETRDTGRGTGGNTVETRDAGRETRMDLKPRSIPAASSGSQPTLTPDLTTPASRVSRPDRSGPKPIESGPIAMTPDEFVRNMWSHAQAAGQELGVDPKTLIAHAALETGWGKSIPCNPDGTCSYNLFGIKAGGKWQGESVRVNTLEFESGVAVRKRESFRAYASPADSFRDYAALLKNNPRYERALGVGDDAAKFATALQQGGYATDPNYAQKLTKTALGVVERVSAMLKTTAAEPIASLGRIAVGGKL
jgi:flagellar protein FlgJ